MEYIVHINKHDNKHSNFVITIWNNDTTIIMNMIKNDVYRLILMKQACWKKHCKKLELGNLVEMIIASQNDRFNLRLAWEIIIQKYNEKIKENGTS